MKLYQEWQKKSQNISTNTFSISIGELINRYEGGTIKINPIYQRHYRWKNEQKSKFIESVLLGYPIPPIFMYRDTQNGYWEIIDGLQRLSTIYEFVGILDISKDQKEKLIKLEKTGILDLLEGTKWEDFKKNGLAFVLESQSLQVTVLDNNSDPKSKYEIFRRLNTSATILSSQEIRNASLSELSPSTFQAIEDKFKTLKFDFLSSKDLAERKDMELFLEFILIKKFISKEYSIEDNLFSTTLDNFSLAITEEELLNGSSKFIEFMTMYNKYEFKHHRNGKSVGPFINAYFEIMTALHFFKNEKLINEDIILKILNKKYSEWQKELKINNPSALNRMKYAIKYAKDLV